MKAGQSLKAANLEGGKINIKGSNESIENLLQEYNFKPNTFEIL